MKVLEMVPLPRSVLSIRKIVPDAMDTELTPSELTAGETGLKLEVTVPALMLVVPE